MLELSSLRFPCGALLAFWVTAHPQAATADKLEERLERFKEQTAMITVTRRDGSVENGAGVVLCQEDGRAYVVTAYHLLAGEAPESKRALRRPARTEVRFYGDRAERFVDERGASPRPGETESRKGVTLYEKRDFRGVSERFFAGDPNLKDNPIGNDTASSVRVDPGCRIVLFEHVDYQGRSTILTHDADRLSGAEVGNNDLSSLEVACRNPGEQRMSFHAVAEDDLVLLSFPLRAPLDLTAGTRLGFFDRASVKRREQSVVFAVGHPISSGQAWVSREGILLPGGGRLLHHSAPVEEGFSGAPLFNEKTLIGIHLRRVTGEEAGAEEPVYGEALSAKQILPAIEEWLPERCRGRIGGRVARFLPSTGSTPSTAELENWKVKGRMSYSEELRFADCRVTEVHRGSIETDSSRWQQTYGFFLDEADGIRWRGECVVGAAVKGEPGGGIRLELSSGKPLTCELEKQGGEAAGRIVIREGSDPNRETEESTDPGTVRIDVVSTRTPGAEGLLSGVRDGYLFYAGERLVGAVDTAADGTVWLHPSAPVETRSVLLAASAALLLNPESD